MKDTNGNWVAQALPPHGVEHHYAPLGLVNRDASGQLMVAQCVCTITPISECTGQLQGKVEKDKVVAPRSR